MSDFNITSREVSPERRAAESALLEYKAKNGHVAMRDLIQRVAGTPAITEIPDDKLAAVVAATKEERAAGTQNGEPVTLDSIRKGAFERFNRTRK